jgi:UDP:flavonoid glycosyltransferase YjiC (YdhE family)
LKAVISSFGSSGDFNPCLGLGRALCEKGVEAIVFGTAAL